MSGTHERWLQQAVALGVENVRSERGGPFGAVIVRDDRVLATGVNLVTGSNDPTAHAEVVAIRAACQALGSFHLSDCDLYASCEPCPMCLGAIYWARIRRFHFACTRRTAAQAGFDDELIYSELNLTPEERSVPGHYLEIPDGLRPFLEWAHSIHKIRY